MRYLSSIVLLLLLLTGCRKNNGEPEGEYVKGDLSFGIRDEVTIDRVFNLINEEHLDVEHIFGYTYVLPYPKDSIHMVRRELVQKMYLKWPQSSATDTPNVFVNSADKMILSTSLFHMSDTANQNDWLRTIGKLSMADRAVTFKNANIHVPDGQEKQWRDYLLQKEIVEWAQLNYIIELQR
ncbi:MAG: hypothetical protein JNL72_05615 [Flavipsychrobacter sp.]|nr:hypothetical protein [Flavipsychrobacter sp.]